ncbi:MAG TPA: sulfide/dihydroorotate dehydrogenase-like FAD/NAD-binding protein [Spirochaetota bacterium]|nr:sulfide/dihydroorotate dehydrogenase-like FAD/NAD-binding protein [Spirochaetota bacterium]HPV96395.1 sulfide/dihydroorotate dehydrogenase-like FAD/NAD-binding protein [Spirochaetota bacterium]
MVVEAPDVARYRRPGQFIMLRVDEYGERIPLTIADVDRETGTITLYYQIVGKTTEKMSLLGDGEYIKDIAGPLGHPTEIKNYGTAVCVGGGIGVAPIYPIASALRAEGNRVIGIIGARTRELVILEREMKEVCDELIVCTDDGSHGRKAFVTDALSDIMEAERVDVVVAIGPVPMMRAVSEQTRPEGIRTLVSLNSIMVDGTGMCGGCRVTVNEEKRFTCVDGPEFDGHQVDFDELMTRLNTYCEEEAQSTQEHRCRLEGGRH